MQLEQIQIKDSDLEWRNFNNTKAGGQNSNKSMDAVTVTHKPTGTTATSTFSRSLQENKTLALKVLKARLAEKQLRQIQNKQNSIRRAAGDGNRGDFRRAIRYQDGIVTDDSGWQVPLKDYLKGNW